MTSSGDQGQTTRSVDVGRVAQLLRKSGQAISTQCKFSGPYSLEESLTPLTAALGHVEEICSTGTGTCVTSVSSRIEANQHLQKMVGLARTLPVYSTGDMHSFLNDLDDLASTWAADVPDTRA
jgi:hypothetical protein